MSKYFIRYDYPVNDKGQSVCITIDADNDKDAKAKAEILYKEQFKEDAKGKIIKCVIYRNEAEVRQFCKEKYGTPFPDDIGFGHIAWWTVPGFARMYSPNHLCSLPSIQCDENIKLRQEWDNLDVDKLGHEEYQKQWREFGDKIKDYPDKDLTEEQLSMLGIEFNPYEHKYEGGHVYIKDGDETMEIAPNFGKLGKYKEPEENDCVMEIEKADFSGMITVEQYKQKYGKDFPENGEIIHTDEMFGSELPLHCTYWAYKRDVERGQKYGPAYCKDIEI
jgi:hypothetical protein